MKKLLLFLCFSILFRPVFPYIDYLLRYEYISNFLCINKEVQSMSCNGKCYLTASLGEVAQEMVSEDYDHSTPKKIEIINLLYVALESKYSDSIDVWHLPVKIFNNPAMDYSYLFIKDLFKPPIFA